MNDCAIIVPIHNMQGRLSNFKSWLNSAIELNFLVVIVNDESTDETSSELEEFLKKYCDQRNLIYICGTYGSPGAARNAGLEKISTKWVVFVDSDDKPNLAAVLEMINSSKFGSNLLIGQYFVEDLSTGARRVQGNGTNPMLQFAKNPGIWRLAFERQLIDKVQFCHSLMGEDQVFIAEVLLNNPRINFYEKPVYTYVVGQQSQATKSPNALNQLPISIRQLISAASKSSLRFGWVVEIMIARQTITALKRGKISTKLDACLLFSLHALNFNPKVKIIQFAGIYNLVRKKRVPDV